MYFIIIIFVFFLTLLLNLKFFFINEEALIFLSLCLFFFTIYLSSNKFVRLLIFKKVEYIYLVFFYLMNICYLLLDIMEQLFLQYLIFLNSFMELSFIDFIYNKLFKFFSLEKPNYLLINSFSNFKSILRLFILNKSSLKVNNLPLRIKMTPSNELLLMVISVERHMRIYLSKKIK